MRQHACPLPVPTSPDTTARTPCLPVLLHRMLRDQTQQERSKAPMDALALLCISEPQKQVVAIGCQVDHSPDTHDFSQLHLTVSSNTMTPQLQSTGPYIRRLWTVMQQISRIRGQERCTLTSPMHQSPPHTASKLEISHLILKLNIIAFKYTFCNSGYEANSANYISDSESVTIVFLPSEDTYLLRVQNP